MNKRPRIALTGGIACGKSLLSSYLNALGVETLDADDVVHELVPADERRRLAKIVFNDPAARRELESRLHPLVKSRLDAWLNGRAACPQAAANGRAACPQAAANRPQSPATDCNRSTALDCPRLQSPPTPPKETLNPELPNLKLVVIPLLFEVHWDEDYDIILCVASSRERQIERMTATRGYTREEALARLAAQTDLSEKAAKSHYVIRNDGTPADLEREARLLVSWLANRVKQQ